MKIIKRENIKDKDYRLILDTETHHNHQIIEDEHGTLRWRHQPIVRRLIDDKLNLNDLMVMLGIMGHDKNSEVVRKLYRDMGYSLFGYWEVFYWEMNNPEADEYVPNPVALPKQFINQTTN